MIGYNNDGRAAVTSGQPSTASKLKHASRLGASKRLVRFLGCAGHQRKHDDSPHNVPQDLRPTSISHKHHLLGTNCAGLPPVAKARPGESGLTAFMCNSALPAPRRKARLRGLFIIPRHRILSITSGFRSPCIPLWSANTPGILRARIGAAGSGRTAAARWAGTSCAWCGRPDCAPSATARRCQTG